MLREIFRQAVHYALKHRAVLDVVLHEVIVDLLLNKHASRVTHLEPLHAETPPHYGQYLRLLIANVDHQTRV